MSSLISPAGDALPDLATLLTQGGELVPALALYHTRHPALGFVIQHPLVYFVPFFPQMAAYANEMLRQKEAALKSAIENKHWTKAVFLHERPWRCEAFSRHADQMDDHDYWSLLAQIYTDSENVDETFDTWADLLASSRPGREAFMQADEQAFLSRLPEEIQVYRGGADGSVTDFSWTVDEGVAAWFAQRTVDMVGGSGPGVVLEGRVLKRDVIGFKNNRSEAEIVVAPECVEIVHERRAMRVPRRR